MARKACFPAARAGKHASGDPVRFFSGDARRGGRRGARSRIWNRLLVGGQASRSHGRGWPASAVSGRVVAGHHFLFPGPVFFLQNADVKRMKSPNGKRSGKYLSADDFKYYFRLTRIDFFRYLPFFFFACFSSTTT